jgi:hypothetical protein
VSRVKTALRSLTNQPGYTIMRSVARFGSVRKAVANTRRTLQRPRLRDFLAGCDAQIAQSEFGSVDREKFVQELRDDGLAFGLRLRDATVQEIRAWANVTPCYADREPAHGFMPTRRGAAEARLAKPILLAQYFNATSGCAAIARLIDDPMLQSIAGLYLESVPTFVGANLWWTFPVQASAADRDRHAHLFHRDVDDFRFLKFFFYLTDVAQGEGAHVCIAASHRRPPLVRRGDRWNIRRYSDDEVSASFRGGDIREICGPAGTGFAENTLCVHKGLTPTRESRLLLQLQYALFDYGVMHDRRDPTKLGYIA